MTIEEMLRIKEKKWKAEGKADTMEEFLANCLLYTSPSPRDRG